MLPAQLKAEQFSGYPPHARAIAAAQIGVLQRLPLTFLPLLLRELIAYDWRFPAEQKELDDQFRYLNSLSSVQLQQAVNAFAKVRLSAELEDVDWINKPVLFSERLSAHLWATHQVDAFRTASLDYVQQWNTARQTELLPVRRLGIVLIGAQVSETRYPLFRKLRPHGVYFNNVQPESGREIVLEAVQARANSHPISFGHWYIDGEAAAASYGPLTCVSFGALDAVRTALVAKMREVMQPGHGGPEVLASTLAQMHPEELGLGGTGAEAVLNRFQMSVLTEGSGTQLFSTTFVQWSAREVLRRAQPVTLLARFAPRRREQSMRDLLAATSHAPALDPEGSLVDADMAAYYTWINQQRLTGAEQASFLVWFEGHNEAVAISPSLHHATQNSSAVDLKQLLSRLT